MELLREGDGGKTRAWHFFERLCQLSKADVYQYSVMLNACVDSHSADKLIERMGKSGIKPSEVTFQKMYKIYLRDARVKDAGHLKAPHAATPLQERVCNAPTPSGPA